MSRIAPAKADLAVLQAQQTVIGDGDAVRVVAEILEHVFRSAERPLGIDNPLVPMALPDHPAKARGAARFRNCPGKRSSPAANAASSAARNLPRNALAMAFTGRNQS